MSGITLDMFRQIYFLVWLNVWHCFILSLCLSLNVNECMSVRMYGVHRYICRLEFKFLSLILDSSVGLSTGIQSASNMVSEALCSNPAFGSILLQQFHVLNSFISTFAAMAGLLCAAISNKHQHLTMVSDVYNSTDIKPLQRERNPWEIMSVMSQRRLFYDSLHLERW